MPTFCSAYSDTGASSPSSVTGTVGIVHPPVVRARGGEHELLDPGGASVREQRLRGAHVDVVRPLGVERTRRVADDRGQVHHLVHALERGAARGLVADVGHDHFDAILPLLGREVLLSMQDHVEHAHVAPGRLHLVDDLHADVAGAACNESSSHRAGILPL